MTSAFFWYYLSGQATATIAVPPNQSAVVYESGSSPWIDELTESQLDNLTVEQLDVMQTLGPLELIIELYPPLGDSTVSYASSMALFLDIPPDQPVPLNPTEITLASDLTVTNEQAVTFDASVVSIVSDPIDLKLDLVIPFDMSVVSILSDDLALEQVGEVGLDPTSITIDNSMVLLLELYPPLQDTAVTYESSCTAVNQATAELIVPTDPTDVSYTSTLVLTSDTYLQPDDSSVSYTSTLSLMLDVESAFDPSTVSYTSTLSLSVDAYLQFDPTDVTYASTAIVRDGAMFLGDYRHSCLPGTVHCYSRVGGVFGAYSRIGGTVLLNYVCTEDDPLAAQLQNTLQIGETNLIEMRCLQDKIDDSYITDATLTVDVIREDTTVLVSGRAMTYEAAADNEGTYRAIITAAETLLLNDDEQITVDINILLTDGAKGFRRQLKRAVYNNAAGVPVTV